MTNPARIHLIGGSGAGKTTVGRRLAERLGLPFIDLDELYWEPGWREVGHPELARRLAPKLEAPGWVVAGNYFATTEKLVWPRATQLVVLDLPFGLMFRRALGRTLRRGLTGEPCCNGNRESLRRMFHHDGVLPYLLRTWRARHRRFATLPTLPALAHARVLLLRTAAEVQAFETTLGKARGASPGGGL